MQICVIMDTQQRFRMNLFQKEDDVIGIGDDDDYQKFKTTWNQIEATSFWMQIKDWLSPSVDMTM